MEHRFATKREFLEWYGKNPEDRKLVDRLILRGEVRMENGMYVYESKGDIIIRLENRVSELEKEIENLKSDNGRVSNEDLEYLNNEYIKLEENRERALRRCYEFMVKRKIFDPEKNSFEDFFNWAIK